MALLLSFASAALLGVFYFGGLYWTIKASLTARLPGLLLLGSLLLRTSIVLTGFYFVSKGSWQRLLACLLGFAVGRIVVTRLVRVSSERPARPTEEAQHAP